MIYRNKNTGVEIDTPCEIKGEQWEEVKKITKSPEKPKKASEKKEDE